MKASRLGRHARPLAILACFSFLLLHAGHNLPAQTKAPTQEPPPADILADGVGAEQVALINDAIAKAWQENKIEPSQRCSDHEFIRRATLDIIGRIATVPEIEQYLKDPARERRSRLIERLLAMPEYATYWANHWTILLLTRRGADKLHQDQMRVWLEDKLTESKDHVPAWDRIVAEILTATGRTNENGAVNFTLAHLGELVKESSVDGEGYDMVPLTSRVTRLFLGIRTQCVQCHDHPFNEEMGQHQFWGLNAFLRQVEAPQGRPGVTRQNNLAARQHEIRDNANLNPRSLVPYERRSGVLLYIDPTFLDGRKMVRKPGQTRRQALADRITRSPDFARAHVNRMWAHFFGRGFSKDAVDDFGEHNPLSHPVLLDRLAGDWAHRYGHNPKELIRWICNSRPYHLSSIANPSNDKPEDEAYFARMLLKPMSPEQLFESLMIATQARAGQVEDRKAKLSEEWLDKLIDNFGDDEGNERSFSGTVVQALLLMHGKEIDEAITDKKHGTVATVLKNRAHSRLAIREAISDLFLAALNRPPTRDELDKIQDRRSVVLSQTKIRDPSAFVSAFYQDLFWAILNSNEFILNH
ncbi:MAG: DUF1549 domain-containing protein [Planctomycetes bacterium]|nr:DUF1549 domain-containing protein [Planctomycetota bacterium]